MEIISSDATTKNSSSYSRNNNNKKNQLPDQPQQKIQNNIHMIYIYMIYIYFYMFNIVYRLSYDCDMQYISYKKIYTI